jgi:hypothetical protein
LSFNKLRSSLNDLDAWILVINSRGINVWCAAGKGTFGTVEIIKCLNQYKISEIVKHKTIIVPQLGASGVSAFMIRKESGFKVIFGPVRAKDIASFIKNKMTATKEMRTVYFSFLERLVLTPVELSQSIKYPAVIIPIVYFLTYMTQQLGLGHLLTILFIFSFLSGNVILQLLLPLLPFRSFVLNGWIFGFIPPFIVLFFTTLVLKISAVFAIFFLFPAITAFLFFNFTGCTTYTNPSGVKKEMTLFFWPLVISMGLGAILLVLSILGVV